MINSAEEIQIQLNNLYKEKLNKSNVFSLEKKELLSAPLLIKTYKSYLDSDIKIMYVGKETNHWLTHTSIPIEKRGLNGVYIKEDSLDIDRLLKRYDKRMTERYNWIKNALFNQYKNIKDQLVDTNIGSGSVVWNNLFKMSYNRGKRYSKTSLGHKGLQKLSKYIFLKELEILKPNILIFVTGASYDKVIKDYLEDYKTIKVIIPKKLWKFKYKNIVCYRTVHPDSIRFIKKELREDYYQMIIDDIKKELK